jgi:hypothetical protein
MFFITDIFLALFYKIDHRLTVDIIMILIYTSTHHYVIFYLLTTH